MALRSTLWTLALATAGLTLSATVWTALRETEVSPPEGAAVLEEGAPIELVSDEGTDFIVHDSILSVTDALAVPDGWIVLDGRGRRLHLLDPDLRLVRSTPGEGEGPGELRVPLHLAPLGDSAVAVLDQSGSQLDLFDLEGRYLDRWPALGFCSELRPAGLFPDLDGGLVVYGGCRLPDGREFRAWRVAGDGTVTRVFRGERYDPAEVLVELGQHVVRWRGALYHLAGDGCLRPLEPSTDSSSVHCLSRDEAVRIPDEMRSRLDSVARAAETPGVEFDLPERLPPVAEASWAHPGTLLLVPTPDRRPRMLLLTESDGVRPILGGRPVAMTDAAALLARSFMEGTGFRVATVRDVR